MRVVRTDYCTISYHLAPDKDDASKFVEVNVENIKKVPKLMEVLQQADKNMEEYLNHPKIIMDEDGCYVHRPGYLGLGPDASAVADITVGEAKAIKSMLAHVITKDEIRKVDVPPDTGFNQSYVLENLTDIYINVDGKKYYILLYGVGT